MEENEVLIQEEPMPDPEPAFDPEEWERKRREEWEKLLAPAKATKAQINDHDELTAELLYEVTLLQLGETEV